ncbi:MAG: hypothetical protein V3V67_06690 [Myxococcota bacterium]
MAIVAVQIRRPLTGRYQEHVARIREYKEIVEALGARVRLVSSQYSGRPQTTAPVTEFDDLAQFADVSTKLRASAAFQALGAKIEADPTSQLLETSLGGDVEL